ncbi:cell division protein ZapB [unidentified bacterial endosymbiont]|uniref:cell division protein ZapB n=1 Tax=unidentified bacterial endosymbiont TaxID=2355 RepID=UPI0020A1D728|nr:cell division protein ZapB [unidentified bacterial endosymbiont]
MSFEVFEQLEVKVQQAIDTIALLQMEIDELKGKNRDLQQSTQAATDQYQAVIDENQQLKEQQQSWQTRLHSLLGRMDSV